MTHVNVIQVTHVIHVTHVTHVTHAQVEEIAHRSKEEQQLAAVRLQVTACEACTEGTACTYRM